MRLYFRTLSIIAGLVGLSVLTTGCGDDRVEMAKYAKALSYHLAMSPPPSGWKVIKVTPEKDQKLVVDILVSSERDLAMIAAVSRMKQFAIAKLECPYMTPYLQKSIGLETTVWIRLNSKKRS